MTRQGFTLLVVGWIGELSAVPKQLRGNSRRPARSASSRLKSQAINIPAMAALAGSGRAPARPRIYASARVTTYPEYPRTTRTATRLGSGKPGKRGKNRGGQGGLAWARTDWGTR
jgi:hypothetical protein